MQHFCFPDLGKEKLCSILVFGNVCFNIVVRINHDNVASRGGCWTYSHHCQIADKNPSKRWNGEFRGFRICIGWISTTRFLLWVFMCSINFSLFFCVSFLATTPRATTPHRTLLRLPRPYRCIQANRLPRLQGYHTRATTLHINFWVQAGYHTCG